MRKSELGRAVRVRVAREVVLSGSEASAVCDTLVAAAGALGSAGPAEARELERVFALLEDRLLVEELPACSERG